MEKIGLLYRVSSKPQETDGGGLEVQKRMGEKMSEKLGLLGVEINEGVQSSFKVEINQRPKLVELLDEIQKNLFERALKLRADNMREIDSYEEFKIQINSIGGFFLAHWDGTPETEQKIKELTKATIRCIPLDQVPEQGVCIYSGKPSSGRVLFAKAY